TDSTAFTTSREIAMTQPNDGCTPAGPRVRQTPGIAVDNSRGRNRGRVYVAWISVSADEINPTCPNAMAGPSDAFFASNAGDLPSQSQQQRMYVDGTKDADGRRGAPVSDEFFPNVAVDQQTGASWAS